jgi:hypothetical protein
VPAEALAGEGVRLTVLDGCDPVQLADALEHDLAGAVLVVSAPPGTDTSATELVWDTLDEAFRAEGLDPAAHTVLVAPPDSRLVARAGGAPVVPGPATLPVPDAGGAHLADPGATSQALHPLRGGESLCEVGAWAALTPYALVPAGLAGADVGALLRAALSDAAEAGPTPGAGPAPQPAPAGTEPVTRAGLRHPPATNGPSGAPARTDMPFVAGVELAGRLRGTPGHVALVGPLAESLAQLLVALDHHQPLVVERPGAPGWDGAVLTVGDPAAGEPADGPLAVELLRWQHAVADLCDRPGLPRATTLAPPSPVPGDGRAALVVGEIEIVAPWPSATVSEAVARLVDGAGSLAVHAHLDRHDDASAALLRTELSARTGLVTAFGWAGRALPAAPAVLQITGAGQPGPASGHQRAAADRQAAELERAGVRVLRVHLSDRLVGLVELVRAVQDIHHLT